MAAIDQRLIHVPLEAPNTDIEDYPVINDTARLITITMEYAPYGDLRFFMQERPRMYIEEAFFIWVGRQSLLGLKSLHDNHLLHGIMKPANILAFTGPHTTHIKIGDLGSCVGLSAVCMDDEGRITGCITTHDYAATEMLLAGIPRGNKPVVVGPTADIYSWGSL